MHTWETPDVKVLLDAGISLCPYRFSLPPHPIEFQTIAKLRGRIAEAADTAEVVTISHYHFDHHTPSFEDWVVQLDGGRRNRTPNLSRQNRVDEKSEDKYQS